MKKKAVAFMLAILAGGFGAHKFYLRQTELGIAYIALFIWVGRLFFVPISFLLGWYDAYKLMTMDEIEFDRKYNSYFYRDRYGRRLEHVKEKKNKKTGAYVLLDEIPTKSFKEKKQGYLKPNNKWKESEYYKQSGIKKLRDYDTKGSIEDLNKALELTSNDPAIHFHIACAYSLEENEVKAFNHLDQAVENGFRDFNKIQITDSLAFIRVSEAFELFKKNQYRLNEEVEMYLNKPKEIFKLKQEFPVRIHNENI